LRAALQSTVALVAVSRTALVAVAAALEERQLRKLAGMQVPGQLDSARVACCVQTTTDAQMRQLPQCFVVLPLQAQLSQLQEVHATELASLQVRLAQSKRKNLGSASTATM
jgi:hypothetical protein